MTDSAAVRLKAPVTVAVVVGLADLAETAIGFFAYQSRRNPTLPGASSWAAVYLFGLEAAAGAVILLPAALAAGRSRVAAVGTAGLAWLRFGGVGAVAFLMIFGLGFGGLDATGAFPVLLALVDSLAGVLVCTSIARETAYGCAEARDLPIARRTRLRLR